MVCDKELLCVSAATVFTGFRKNNKRLSNFADKKKIFCKGQY